jgi:3-deoxy-D-manno-octulosonate 8-phosphate phosphatase (KDO 8-P phosphatase)
LSVSGLRADEIAYMGDDVIDLPIFELVGISIAPSDAHPTVRSRANIVTDSCGGRGAVREICDILLGLKF